MGFFGAAWRLKLGLRYTCEIKSPDRYRDDCLAMLALEWNATEDIMTCFTATRDFKDACYRRCRQAAQFGIAAWL